MYLIELYRQSFSNISRRIWMLALVTFVNRAGSMVLPFLSLYLTSKLGFSMSLAGTVLIGYGLGSFFGNWLGGTLSDRIGPFRLQAISLAFSSVAFVSLLFLESPIAFALGLFATSMIADAFRPAGMAAIGVLVPAERRARAVGVIRLAINLGFAAGPAFGGLIAYSIGYNWLFIIDGITCLLAAVILFLFFRTYIRREGENSKVPPSHQVRPSMKLVLKDRVFMQYLVYIFLLGMVFMQLFHTLPVYFKEGMGLLENDIGLIMAVNGALIVLIEMPLIHLLEEKGLLRMIALGSLLIGLSFAALLIGPWAGIAYLCVIILTVGEVLSLPFTTTVSINRAPDHLRGRYLALYGMSFSLCAIAAPVLGLRTADTAGFDTLWIILFGIMLITALGFYRLRGRIF